MSSKKYNKKNKRAQKKELILDSGKKKGSMAMAAVLSVALVAVAAAVVLYSTNGSAPSVANDASAVVTADHVSHPADLFADGQARHFHYANGSQQIKYFVLKSSDGIIRAAFDACDVCWPKGKGYYQEGDAMVCRNCGRKFASIKINEIKGGCNPAPLNRRMEDGRVVIDIRDIIEGGKYFNFKKQV